jgi:hypothetical protein
MGSVLALGLLVGGIDEGGLLLPASVAGAVAVLGLFWRWDRMRVELGTDAVVVVNFWRTVVLPWAEVARFGYDVAAWVERRDGRRLGITPFSPSPEFLPFVERRNREAVRAMDKVRQRRRRRGGGRDRPLD